MTRLRLGHGPRRPPTASGGQLRDTQCHRQAPAGAPTLNPSHQTHGLTGWGEAPLVVGENLVGRHRLVDMQVKQSRALGAMLVVTSEIILCNGGGEVVVREQSQRIFY